MIANLPLLFANGNPTTLAKINVQELERFVTFMVHCSWGHDTAKEIKKPDWWPDDVEFSDPFRKPATTPADWAIRLRRLVRRCYDYHKSEFLLVFSAELSKYSRKKLQYVDNRDRTTSLYYIPSGRLLVTFRNENMYYDRYAQQAIADVKPAVEAADIYLCDNCDSHFDNLQTLKSHERLCGGTSSDRHNEPMAPTNINDFLATLKLKPKNEIKKSETTQSCNSKSRNWEKSCPYPFSSSMGIKVYRMTVERDWNQYKDRIERFCDKNEVKPKGITRSQNSYFPIRYKRPQDYWDRRMRFPSQKKKLILDLKSQLLFLKCKSLRVVLQKMTQEYVDSYLAALSAMRKLKQAELLKRKAKDDDIEFVSETIFPSERHLSVNISSRLELSTDVIDLCSDEEGGCENRDPLGVGVAAPRALPAAPCGAARRRPHPLPLYTHILNNVHIILE